MIFLKRSLALLVFAFLITGNAVAEPNNSNDSEVVVAPDEDASSDVLSRNLATGNSRKKKKCFPPYETKECPLKPFTK